jgi:hypothetical protein
MVVKDAVCHAPNVRQAVLIIQRGLYAGELHAICLL